MHATKRMQCLEENVCGAEAARLADQRNRARLIEYAKRNAGLDLAADTEGIGGETLENLRQGVTARDDERVDKSLFNHVSDDLAQSLRDSSRVRRRGVGSDGDDIRRSKLRADGIGH